MNNVSKRYVYKDKIVFLLDTDKGYIFKITSKTQKGLEYYSLPYNDIKTCESESYKVCKAI